MLDTKSMLRLGASSNVTIRLLTGLHRDILVTFCSCFSHGHFRDSSGRSYPFLCGFGTLEKLSLTHCQVCTFFLPANISHLDLEHLHPIPSNRAFRPNLKYGCLFSSNAVPSSLTWWSKCNSVPRIGSDRSANLGELRLGCVVSWAVRWSLY